MGSVFVFEILSDSHWMLPMMIYLMEVEMKSVVFEML